MKKNSIQITSLFLAFILCLSSLTIPAEARASDYIRNCSAHVSAAGSGKVTVSFSITGTSTMTSIGATKIEIKNSSGTTIKTYLNTDVGCSSMMGSNRTTYSSSVTYQGVAGVTYYAVVYFKAGNSSGSDTDSVTTYTCKAT